MDKIDLSRINSSQEHSAQKVTNKTTSTFPRSSPRPPSAQGAEQKKVNRRSNRLIINWLHRKLVGTVKKPEGTLNTRQKVRSSFRATNRLASSPLPSQASNNGRIHARSESSAAITMRKTVSSNGDDDANDRPQDDEDDISYRPSSLTRDSIWSPASFLEADDDASVRPLPPSIPPSPSPSRSSSSYLSHPHTFKSMAASTKPTTLLSIDLSGNGMAHIAQAPLTAPSHINRFSSQPHARQSSLTSGSISFAALSTTGPSRSGSSTLNGSASPSPHLLSVQAPLHTAHHPRNNPRPSSPPMDNASVLTLASSAFGMPGRQGIAGYSSATASALGAGDSISHFDGSVTYPDVESTSIVIGDDDRLDERDMDASVRALRPRSSRRGSWESEASGWSARINPGSPSLLREKSLWTSNSVKTEGFSADNVEAGQDEQSETGKDDVQNIEVVPDTADKLSQHLSEPGAVLEPGISSDKERCSIDTVAHTEESTAPRVDVASLKVPSIAGEGEALTVNL